MESQRFDNLSRMVANGASRRTVLRGVVGGVLAAAGLRGGAVAKPNKVDICHRTGNGTYQKINVSENALQAHLDHGDDGGAGCPAGSAFNLERCACETVVDDCTEGSIGTPCADGEGVCARSADTASLMCVRCESHRGRRECGSGTRCQDNEGCVGENHVCVAVRENGDYRCQEPI